MYGIPETIDWSFLQGAVVTQIAIGQFQLQIHLYKSIHIAIYGEFDHLSAGKCLSTSSELPVRSTTLVSLLGAKVEKAAAEGAKKLVLWFSNQEILNVYDSYENYESFTVTYPGPTIIV